MPIILPKLMEGHDVLWRDIAAIATHVAMRVAAPAFAPQRYLVRVISFGPTQRGKKQ